MAGPWEQYAAPSASAEGPWSRYAAPAAPQLTPEQADARQANSGVGGFLRGTQRALEQGQWAGFRDEAQAFADATVGRGVGLLAGTPGTWSEIYDQSLARERARSTDFQEQHPVVSGAANLAGGVTAPLPAFSRLFSGARGALGLGAAAVRGGAAGATGGAVAGFGEGEGGIANRLESTALGAGLGAAGGAALGLGANVGSRIGGRLLDVAGLRNPETAAERQILRALERDNRPLSDVAAEAAAPQGGAPLALADLGGRNTTSLAAVAANVPGRSMEAADALVQGRRAAGPDRIAAAADRAFGGGGGGDVADATARLSAQRAADARPLYDEAFSRPAGFTDRMQSVLDDPITRQGLARGLEVQRLENTARRARGEPEVPMDERGIRFDDDGTPRIVSEPNMRTLDAVKRGLDDIIEAARDSTTGRIQWTERLRAIDEVRRGWVALLDQGNDVYAQARAAWSGPSQSLDAVERGRRAFTTDRDAVAGVVPRLSPGDQEFYRLGAGRQLTDMASDPARSPGVARRLLEDRQMRARLESLLPPDRNAALAEALRGEVRVNAGNAAYSPRAGSQTARLQAGMDDAQIDPPGGMVMALLNATQRGGITGAGAKGLEVLYRRGQGINSSTADALASRLFSTDQAQNGALVQALVGRQRADMANDAGRRSLLARILQGGGTAAGLTAN